MTEKLSSSWRDTLCDPHILFDHVVDCAANPRDLRPAVDAITTLVRLAMAEEALKGDKGRKVALVMGELHGMPAHILLQQACMLALKDLNPLLALEFSYNTRKVISVSSHISRSSLVRSAHKSGLTVLFNDAAKSSGLFFDKNGLFFDKKDPMTKPYIEKYDKNLLDVEIHMASPAGMAIRNLFMSGYAGDMMRILGSSLVIQTTGADHVFGEIFENPFSESLSQRYKEEGLRVIAVVPDTCSYVSLKNLEHENIQTVLIQNLADDVYINLNNHKRLSCLKNRALSWMGRSYPGDEHEFIRSVAKNSNLIIPHNLPGFCFSTLNQTWLPEHLRLPEHS